MDPPEAKTTEGTYRGMLSDASAAFLGIPFADAPIGIHRSAGPAAGLPVFVWIHGGGYFAGSPASPWYDGRTFNRNGVVTVTVSHRLGFDGFGWIDGAPLNRCILDQIAALEWVQRNIRSFGGDPSQVVVGGQSAGGGSVFALLTSTRTNGLFQQAISHSGIIGSLSEDEAEQIGRASAATLDIEPTLAGWRKP